MTLNSQIPHVLLYLHQNLSCFMEDKKAKHCIHPIIWGIIQSTSNHYLWVAIAHVPYGRFPSTLFWDNQATRHIAQSFHEKTEHIDLDCHTLREKLKVGMFHLLPIKTTKQIVDAFTKPLKPEASRVVYPSLVRWTFILQLDGGY